MAYLKMNSHRESLCGFLLRSKADIVVEPIYERGVNFAYC